MNPGWITPRWPAPANVQALSTTRAGGCSTGAWATLNLGEHCGDDPAHVRRNRACLAGKLPAPPMWLRQVHGATVVRHGGGSADGKAPEADAVVADAPDRVCAVLTADCLPVLFCDRDGSRVAAAHAGWRGLAAGVLEATVAALAVPSEELLAWLGPAIGPAVYEVGEDVAAAFPGEDGKGLRPRGDRWLLDLYGVARRRLAGAGVGTVYGGAYCTFSEPARFYSFRRDGITGRMASAIWLS